MSLLLSTLATFLSIYFVLVIVRGLLTWFPNIDWYSQPFAALSQITDPYLNLFRPLLPPVAGFDLSYILAIVVLQVALGLFSQFGYRSPIGF